MALSQNVTCADILVAQSLHVVNGRHHNTFDVSRSRQADHMGLVAVTEVEQDDGSSQAASYASSWHNPCKKQNIVQLMDIDRIWIITSKY